MFETKLIYHIYWGTSGNSGLYLDEIFERNKEVPLIALNTINSMARAGRVNGKRLWKSLCLRR